MAALAFVCCGRPARWFMELGKLEGDYCADQNDSSVLLPRQTTIFNTEKHGVGNFAHLRDITRIE